VKASTDNQQREERNKILESVLLSDDSREEILLENEYRNPILR